MTASHFSLLCIIPAEVYRFSHLSNTVWKGFTSFLQAETDEYPSIGFQGRPR